MGRDKAAGAPAAWTIAGVLSATADYLKARRIDSPRLEAEILVAHALNVTRVDLYTQYDRPLGEGERSAVREALRRRAGGEPIQHITGLKAFRHLILNVTPAVLIPRPETELLVDAVIKWIKLKQGPVSVLDLGTGSGAIALSIAHEAENARVWAGDISADALAVARDNARRCGLEERVTFFAGDLYEDLARHASGSFDVIVANPPYVRTSDISTLPGDVRDCEPIVALDGGADGLSFYRRIVDGAPDHLAGDGIIAFEVGAGQAPAVRDLLREAGFAGVDIQPDYAGIERIVVAHRAA